MTGMSVKTAMTTYNPTLRSVKRAGYLYDLHENSHKSYREIGLIARLSERQVVRLVTMYKKYLKGELA